MQVGLLCSLIAKFHVEHFAQTLHCAFQIKEVVIAAPNGKGDMFALGRLLACRRVVRDIHVSDLKLSTDIVAAADISYRVAQHRRQQDGTHNRKLFANGVQNFHRVAFGSVACKLD